MSLTVALDTFSIDAVRGKYPGDIFDHIAKTNGELNKLAGAYGTKFAIPVEHRFYLTKDKEGATECVRIVSESENHVAIVKAPTNPNDTHTYTLKKAIAFIKQRLKERGVSLLLNGTKVEFNKWHCQLLIDYFRIKSFADLCYIDTHEKMQRYYYRQKAVDLILRELCKDPENILTELKSKKAPGAKEF